MNAVPKFSNPDWTAQGEQRAWVDLDKLTTLWFNTGTLCNLTCVNCYIESSPSNDRLVYLTAAEVSAYLDEIGTHNMGTEEIGFTGGEPFMNPDFIAMLEDCLSRGYKTLVLTNAMRPMMKCQHAFSELNTRFGDQLEVRVSIDHYDRVKHESERGKRSWNPAINGIQWLAEQGFNLSLAGRTYWGEDETSMRAGYRQLLQSMGVELDCDDPSRLVLFPEMDTDADVPEITTACWDILNKSPGEVMCASSRMIVKRKGAAKPAVIACTLLPYDTEFELGNTLATASRSVKLNHPHCAKFCVLGGGSCTA